MSRALPTPELHLRRPTARDYNYIADGWKKSNKGLAARLHMSPDLYYHHQGHIIERLWKDEGVMWLVACRPADPDFIYGWLCGEGTDAGPLVHYLYVKVSARRLGIASALLSSFLLGQPGRLWMTHWTGEGQGYLHSDAGRACLEAAGIEGWEVDPFLLLEREGWGRS